MPCLGLERSLGSQAGKTSKALGLVQDHHFGGDIPSVGPAIVVRIRRGARTIAWKCQAFDFGSISGEIRKLRLHVANWDARWRQDTGVGRGPLADNFQLPFP